MQSTYRILAALVVGGLLTAALLLGAATTAAAQEDPASGDAQTDLRINELMASNGSTLFDPDDPSRAPDWIEIYNAGNTAVSLRGMALTDDPARLDKHVITQEVTIAAKGFLILFADNDPERGPLHLDFALSAQGEYVALSRLDAAGAATIIDEIDFPALERDIAYARSVDGAGAWRIARATPGKSNSVNPPWISQVTQPVVTPEQPAPTGPFTVSAIITDDVAVADAAIVFMTMTTPYTDTTALWVNTPMTLADGDRYEGVIPAMPEGTLVRYYIEARDDEDDLSRFPLRGREFGYLAGYRPPQLVINRIVSRNDFIPDPDEPAEKPDWIELYNPGTQPILLDGLSITNDSNESLKFRVPAGITLDPQQLIVFLADDDRGQNTLPGHQVWHMNFNLDNANDFVGVYGGEGTTLIDGFDWDQRPWWGAFGRVPDGGEWSDQVCVLAMKTSNLLCDQIIFLPSVQR